MYTILLVDDEPAILNSLAKAAPWSEFGFQTVLKASNGASALKLMEENPVDILITDIQMPVMDGIRLMRQARRLRPNMRFVVLTAYDKFEYALEALRLGADNYLLKPIDTDELVSTVEKALGNLLKSSAGQKDAGGEEKPGSVFAQNVLSRWVAGDLTGAELSERAKWAGINIYRKQYVVAVAYAAKGHDPASRYGEACDALAKRYECRCFADADGAMVYIAGGAEVKAEDVKEAFEAALPKQTPAGGEPLVAVGTVASGADEVHVSFLAAKAAFRRKADFCGQTVVLAQFPEKSLGDGSSPDIAMGEVSPMVARAAEYIREHYGEPLSIRQIADIMRANASYLGYLFKKETGEYFSNYLNGCRIQAATGLLLHTDTPVQDIAREVGYADVSYFIQKFNKANGVSPAKYRQMYSV